MCFSLDEEGGFTFDVHFDANASNNHRVLAWTTSAVRGHESGRRQEPEAISQQIVVENHLKDGRKLCLAVFVPDL